VGGREDASERDIMGNLETQSAAMKRTRREKHETKCGRWRRRTLILGKGILGLEASVPVVQVADLRI